MLFYTRENLVALLLPVPQLVDQLQRNDAGFPAATIAWLQQAEQTLARLRLPTVSLVAVERGKVVATQQGCSPPRPESSPGTRRPSARKATAFTALAAIDAVQAALRSLLAEQERRIDLAREKMTQLVAVGSAQSALPLPPTDPRDAWLDAVWRALNRNGETAGMYRYLGASLSLLDRRQLLDEVLTPLLDRLG